jgi:hypothetical protein
MKWLVFTAVTFASVITTCVNPKLLSENTFLTELVSHEILSMLVVLLTITMASVANIHLALGKLKNSLLAKGVDITPNIQRARGQLSRNAWSMFASFCVLLVVLLIKGHVTTEFWIAACHAAAIIIVSFNLLILYDIYISTFMLTSLDTSPHDGQRGEDGSEIP